MYHNVSKIPIISTCAVDCLMLNWFFPFFSVQFNLFIFIIIKTLTLSVCYKMLMYSIFLWKYQDRLVNLNTNICNNHVWFWKISLSFIDASYVRTRFTNSFENVIVRFTICFGKQKICSFKANEKSSHKCLNLFTNKNNQLKIV